MTPAHLDLNFPSSVRVWGVCSVHRVYELLRERAAYKGSEPCFGREGKVQRKGSYPNTRLREPQAGRGARAQLGSSHRDADSRAGPGQPARRWLLSEPPREAILLSISYKAFPLRRAHRGLWKISFDFFLFLPSV